MAHALGGKVHANPAGPRIARGSLQVTERGQALGFGGRDLPTLLALQREQPGAAGVGAAGCGWRSWWAQKWCRGRPPFFKINFVKDWPNPSP